MPSATIQPLREERLHELLRRLNREQGLTVVAVTHNDRLAAACDRTLRLTGGRLQPEAAAGGGSAASSSGI